MAALKRHSGPTLVVGILLAAALWAVVPPLFVDEAQAASPTLTEISDKLDVLLQDQVTLLTSNADQSADDARVPRSWIGLPSAATDRYEIVLPVDFGEPVGVQGVGVLDHRTGLIWARTPENSNFTWNQGVATATARANGGATGWRLPTIAEFASIMVDTNDDNVADEIDPDFPVGPGNPQGSFWTKEQHGRLVPNYTAGSTTSLVPHAVVFSWTNGSGNVTLSDDAVESYSDSGGTFHSAPERRLWLVIGPE